MNRTCLVSAVRRRPRGFTLLEVILAVLLTSLVLIALGMAIDIHLRLVDSSRTGVEEAQLARELLDRIADDLRGTVLYNPIDADELLKDVTASTGGSAGADGGGGGGGGTAAGGGGSTGTGGGDTTTEESDESEETETDRTSDLAGSGGPQSIPGLFGNSYELQIDTSRLPRIDQYAATQYGTTQYGATLSAAGSSPTNLVSDVKTVIYYAISDLQGGTGYASSVSEQRSGLVRRELDRATAIFAAEQGQLIGTEDSMEFVAPEVAAIEFQYFDGTQWLPEWDSIERDGLPVAVEIAIGLIPARLRNNRSGSVGTTIQPAYTENDLLIFRRIVHLPVAQPTTTEGTSGAWDAWSEESSEESAGTAGAGEGGSGR